MPQPDSAQQEGAVVIRSHFGLAKEPFSTENMAILPHQREVLDILRVHCQQGGLCIIVGPPCQ